MTTIAASTAWGYMAADRQIGNGNFIVGSAGKMERIGEMIVGCAGRTSDAIQFCEWLRSGKPSSESPELNDDFTALVLSPDGLFIYDDACVAMPAGNEVAAIGSGAAFALGAMHADCAPVAAVSIACDLDAYTGGDIDVKNL